MSFDSSLARAWRLPGADTAWWRGVEVDRSPWLLPAALVLPLMAWVAHYATSGRQAFVTGPDLGIFLYVTGAQIGFTQSIAVDGSKARLLGIFGATYLYYLVYRTASGPRARWCWLLAFLAATIFCALFVLSLLGFQLPADAGFPTLNRLADVVRPYALGPVDDESFFELSQRLVVHPNGIADCAAVLAMIATTFAWFARPAPVCIGWAAAALAGIGAVLLSGSRGGLIALAGGLVALVAVLRPRLLPVLIPLALVALVLKTVPLSKVEAITGALIHNGPLAALDALTAPVYSWRSDATQAVVPRLRIWSGYWGVVRAMPLTGAGLGLKSVAQTYSGEYGLQLYFSESHAHNVVLQTFLEQTAFGVVGLGVMVFTLTRSVLGSVRRLVSAGGVAPTARIALAAWIACCGLLAHSALDVNLNTNLFTALFFGLIGLGLRAAQDAPAEAPEPEAIRLLPEAGAPSARAVLWTLAGAIVLTLALSSWTPPFAPLLQVR